MTPTSSSRLDTTLPTGAWQVQTRMTKLPPETSYTLYGWTHDNSCSAAGVEFTLKDLKQLRPGADPVRRWLAT